MWKVPCTDRHKSVHPQDLQGRSDCLPLLPWCSGVFLPAVICLLQLRNLVFYVAHLNCVPVTGEYFSCVACSVFFAFSSLDWSASKDSLSDKSSPQSQTGWSSADWRKQLWEGWCEEYKDICQSVCVWYCSILGAASICAFAEEPCTWCMFELVLQTIPCWSCEAH